MEYDLVSENLFQEQEYNDLAEVIKGDSASLGSLQLTPQEVVKLLLQLLTRSRSKEITTAISKESTSGYAYDDDYTTRSNNIFAKPIAA